MIDLVYELLGKIGFHDPIHALLVHMPIGLVFGALTLFLVAVLFGRKRLVPTARHAAILAFVFVFPTILSGVFDWMHFYRGALIPPIQAKMVLAGAVLLVLGAAVILGGEVRVPSVVMAAVYALAFVAVVGLGYFGGSLVYGKWSSSARGAASSHTVAANAVGERVFSASCIGCHRNGGNSVRADRPLKKSRLLDDRDQFVAFLREPSGAMPRFAAAAIGDGEAGELFAYLTAMRGVWK